RPSTPSSSLALPPWNSRPVAVRAAEERRPAPSPEPAASAYRDADMHSRFHGGTTKMTLRKISMRNRILAAPAVAALALGPVPLRGQDASPVASPGATPVSREDLPTEQVTMLTGPEPSINNTWEQWEVYGPDLGSSFMFGDEVYIVFGDT